MTIDVNRKLFQNKNIIEANIDDDKVMIDVESGKYFGLDSVSSQIWSLIDQELTLNEIVCQLTQLYKVDKQICMEETMLFIEELIDNKLVFLETL